MRRAHIGSFVAIVSVAAGGTLGCGTPAPDDAAVAIRLVEQFKPESLSGSAAAGAQAAPRQEWKFDAQPPANIPKPFAATWGFEAGRGITGFAIKDGRLTGRTTSDFPILRIERIADLESRDQLQAIEIRMRASAGTNLAVATRGAGPVDFDNVERTGRRTPWNTTTPLQTGDQIHTYTLISPAPLNLSRVRHVLIRPSDATGATFEIESVRIVSRREHLAGMTSGVGWQGLAEIYRETLVTRSPETMKMTVTLPDRPWLDLAVGIPDDRPATFRIGIARGGEEQQLLQHTVTTPYRWEPRAIDLSAYAGQEVTLSLSIAAQDAGALGFWGAPVVRARHETPADRPRGVILIHADTLRPDHLDLYRHSRQTAPLLTKIAGEGVTFERAYSQAGWTKVSATSFLTSLYPTTHGVAKQADRLPASATTLAEVYRAAGYATFATSSVPFTGQYTNLHQGVEELHEVASLVDAVGAYTAKTAREYVDRTAEWIDRQRDGSFFVYLHVFDPHSPYEPRRPYDVLWADPAKRDAHIAQRDSLRKTVADTAYAGRGMATREEMLKAGVDPAAYLAYDKDWYDSSIRGLDAELARLVERLRTAGVDRDTLIVLLSDHGEEFQDHGRMWHGQSVYGEMVHVPLIVRWPARVPPGARVEEPVQLVDVMPTLLSLSGLTAPPGLHGQSLVPLLQVPGGEAGTWKRRPVIVEKLALDGSDHPQNLETTGIIDGEWKLIHNRTRPPDRPEFELFHAKHDPLDQKNLAAENPETVQRLAKAIEGWRTMAEAARLKPDAESTKGLSPEQLQRLRSLGYVR
jgi:arylsulfatase A-like enzyme